MALMNTPAPYNIYSLGDSALTLDYGNIIDEQVNKKVLQIFHELKANPLPGMIEAIPAYSSVTIYYDIQKLKKTFLDGEIFSQVPCLKKNIQAIAGRRPGDIKNWALSQMKLILSFGRHCST